MKRILSISLSVAFTAMLFMSFTLNAVECGPTEQNDKVLADFECPDNEGQLYKRCVISLDKCCDSVNAESCEPPQQ